MQADSNASFCPRQALLLLILAIAAGMRMARIDFDSLSFDEQWHLELSTGRGSPHVRLPTDTLIADAPAVTSLKGARPWWAVWTNMDYVVHPPLYCLLLRLWREVFGESDTAARAFSITCSLIAIALLMAAGRRLHGTACAAWAGLMMATAPAQVLLSQQVRGYPLVQALGMGAVVALVGLEKAPSPQPPHASRKGRVAAIALGLCVLGMMLTHYFAIGVAAAIGIYILLRLRGRVRREAIVALVAAAAVYAIIWGPFLWEQRQYVTETADVWLKENVPRHGLLTLERLATSPGRLAFYTRQMQPWQWAAAILLILPLFLLHRRPQLLLWCLWLAGTLGFVAALDLIRGTGHLRLVRYVSLASPAVFILLAAMLGSLPPLWRHAAATVVVLFSVVGWRMAYVREEPDWRELGKLIDAKVLPSEAMIFYHGRQPKWHSEIYYLAAAHYSRAFPRTIVRLSAAASPGLVRQLPGKTAWLISGQPDRDIGEILPGAGVIEQFVVPSLAVCTHVRLREGSEEAAWGAARR